MSDPYERCAGCFAKEGEIEKLKAALVAMATRANGYGHRLVLLGENDIVFSASYFPDALSGMEASK